MAVGDISELTCLINLQPGVDTLWLSSGSESTGPQLGLIRTDCAIPIQLQDKKLRHLFTHCSAHGSVPNVPQKFNDAVSELDLLCFVSSGEKLQHIKRSTCHDNGEC